MNIIYYLLIYLKIFPIIINNKYQRNITLVESNQCESNTGKSCKPSPLGDGQSKALSSFSCPKNSNNKPALLSVGKLKEFLILIIKLLYHYLS